MSPCILWGDIFCWERGDWVVRRRDVVILGVDREVRGCGFVVVKWEFFGCLVRRFLRMSVVEWLCTLVPVSVQFLVKIYPLAEKYNTMVKRLHFLLAVANWKYLLLVSRCNCSINCTIRISTVIQFYIFFIHLY